MERSDRELAVVREASEVDVDAFAEFFVAAWRQSGPDAPGFVGATDEVIAELTTRDAVRERIGGPDRRMFLAWADDCVVGFPATKRINVDTVELAGIIVLPSYAGRGVGTELVDEALLGMRGDLYRSMIVRTETTNDLARAFYEARGFLLERVTVENVDDISVDVWELSRDL
jgi:ribosomal protein S18 acetylase RimI-like enzyme